MQTTLTKNKIAATLIRVAWMSVLLGLGMELLLLVAAAVFHQSTAFLAVVADTVHKVSWSTIVCTGVAAGLAATKMRAPMMGLAGLIAAPMAFYIAKAAHKSMIQALSLAGTAASGPSPLLLASIKGVEYAVLGFIIGYLSKKALTSFRNYLAAGTGVGLAFGGTIVGLVVSMAAEPLPAIALATRCINEMIFPIGCAVVLYAAQKLGEKHEVERPEGDAPEQA